MKVRHIVLVFLVFLLLFSCREADDDPQELYLEGTVTDSEGNSITGAEVFLVFDIQQGSYSKDDKDPTYVSEIFYQVSGGQMIFHWTTTFELNLTEFNILRGNPYDHNAINTSPIIPYNNPSGSTYTYTHNTLISDVFWLEAKDTYGLDQFLGPFVQYVPVEISSFTATLNAQHQVELNWTSEAEANLQGYVILRGDTDQLTGAIPVSSLIPATNTSSPHSYSFTDTYVMENYTYYYWLQGLSTFGGTDHWGPISITVSPLFPPELSSFTVLENAQHFADLNWTSQSETNLQGWYVCRSDTTFLEYAIQISSLINAFNESTPHTYSYTDSEVEQGHSYYYWLKCINFDGNSSYFGPVHLQMDPYIPPILPPEFLVRNPYPNPAVHEVHIEVAVPDSHYATIVIKRAGFSQTLKEYTLYPGNHHLVWDCADEDGIKQSNGCYIATGTLTHVRSKNRSTQYSRHFLINSMALDNLPNAITNASGYSIFLANEFIWDQLYLYTDAFGNNLGESTLPLSVTVYVKKEGYVTTSKHVTLLPDQANVLHFVLQPTHKVAKIK